MTKTQISRIKQKQIIIEMEFEKYSVLFFFLLFLAENSKIKK